VSAVILKIREEVCIFYRTCFNPVSCFPGVCDSVFDIILDCNQMRIVAIAQCIDSFDTGKYRM
jgi:hypothetical protein